MKNLKVKIGLVSVLIIGIAITGFLYSCEKEDKNETTKTQAEISENLDKDYQTYIDELMAKTGVDIYALSQLSEVKKVAEQNVRMIENTMKYSTKGDLTDEKTAQIQKLATEIQTKYNAGDNDAVLVLFESLCNISKTIDDFAFDVNNYGLNDFSYDKKTSTVNISVARVGAEQLQATRILREVNVVSPEFDRLSQPIQTEVLAAAICVSSQSIFSESKTMTKERYTGGNSQLEQCRQNAAAWLIAEQTVAHGVLVGGLIGCGVSFFGYPVCAAGVVALYSFAVASSINSYNTAIENCNLKYR